MKTYPVITANNTIIDVEALEFSETFQSESSDFLVHESLVQIGQLVVTHKESGRKLCDIPTLTKQSLSDEGVLIEARLALAALANKVGVARMRSTLAGAKPITEYMQED